jgi:hypothetical protein
MSNPQQPELARSRKTPAQDQDAVAGVLDGQREIGADAPRGPVPPENQPGHHPAEEQDKPDLNAFAERLGTVPASERDESSVERPRATDRAGSRRVVAAVAALVSVVLAVVAGRRLRSRRRR